MSEAAVLMQYDVNRKSTGVAYLLWFFLGGFGAHRFYLGRGGSGAAILIITLVSMLLTVVLVGFVTIWISAVWVFIDLFLIPGWVYEHNSGLAARLNHPSKAFPS